MAYNKNSSYSLIKPFFEFAFTHHECKCQHIALFSWLVELNNKLGWKDQFGLPTYDTMEGLSIGNKNTYYKALKDLESWGFLKVVIHSKNQYQANIIKLCQFKSEPAPNQALIQHDTKQRTSIVPSSDPIVKPFKTDKNLLKPLLTLSPTIEDCLKYFSEKKIEKVEAENFFSKYTAIGWKINNSQIENWMAIADIWIRNIYKNSQNKKNNQSPPAPKKQAFGSWDK